MLPETMIWKYPKKPALANFVFLRRWKAFFMRFLTLENARKPIYTYVTSYEINSKHQITPPTRAFQGEIITA